MSRINHLKFSILVIRLASLVAGQVYSGCEEDVYYSALSTSPSRTEISNLLRSTHRNVLPYTSNREDTWDALMDLDPGSQPSTVRLIYSDHEPIGQPLSGQSRAWNREHLWPKSHGVGFDGADFTDVHHLRPADVNVNSARGNKYFGACGTVEPLNSCRSPAHPEANSVTSTDGEVWYPSPAVRGDIARAMFYMELRYSGVGSDPKLELTDCPTSKSDNKLAYLSQLIEWHQSDPVDQAERDRNSRVCERWQGNRNIFVDFPDLVGQLYGEPAAHNGENGYECSDDWNQPAPTSPPLDSSACSTLEAGDVQIIGMHSDFPDEVVLVALVDLPVGLELQITDDGWAGTQFRNAEGTAKLVVPTGGISAGTIFGYGGESSALQYADSWSATGSFALSTQGDSVIVYCQSSQGNYNFLAAMTNNNAWASNPSDSHNSDLPPGLENTNIALPHFDNYIYVGPTEGKKEELVASFVDVSNWSGSDNAQALTFSGSFIVTPPRMESSCANLKAGDVQVVGVHSDNPDEIAIVALVDLPARLELYLTDSGWAGTEFRDQEGTATLIVPAGGIAGGTIFGFSEDSTLFLAGAWEQTGAFALSTQGDSIIVYCQPSLGKYNFLGAVTSNNEWDLNQSDSNNSGLPPGLERASIALPHLDNYIYIGPTEGTKDDLIAAIRNEEYWSGFDNARPLRFDYSFSVFSGAIIDCEGLRAGDVQIIGIHSDNPDEIALAAFQDLPAGLELYLTDKAWTGDGFRESAEGTVKLTVPQSGIRKGTIFGFGSETSLEYASSWSKVSGSLALSTQGDTLAVYCKPTEATYNFVAALSFNGPWVDIGFSSHNSALPPGLEQANTELGHRDNYRYVGPKSGTRNGLITAIGDSLNWRGSDSSESFAYDTPFTILSSWNGDNDVFFTSSGGGGEGSASSTVAISPLFFLAMVLILWNK